MATSFRIRCEACDGPGESGEKGLCVPAESRAYVDADERLVPLPHPIDPARLRELGTTWHRAAIHGRILRVRNLVCADCGTLNTDVSTTYVTSTGCLTGLALAVGAYVLLHRVLDVGQDLALVVGYALLILPSIAMSLYVTIRYRERTRRLGFKGCVKCGSRSVVKVSKARGRVLPCPSCGGKALKVSFDR